MVSGLPYRGRGGGNTEADDNQLASVDNQENLTNHDLRRRQNAQVGASVVEYTSYNDKIY